MSEGRRITLIEGLSRRTNALVEKALFVLGALMVGGGVRPGFLPLCAQSLPFLVGGAGPLHPGLADVPGRYGGLSPRVAPAHRLVVLRSAFPLGQGHTHRGPSGGDGLFRFARHLRDSVRLLCAAADFAGPSTSQVDRHAGPARQRSAAAAARPGRHRDRDPGSASRDGRSPAYKPAGAPGPEHAPSPLPSAERRWWASWSRAISR